MYWPYCHCYNCTIWALTLKPSQPINYDKEISVAIVPLWTGLYEPQNALFLGYPFHFTLREIMPHTFLWSLPIHIMNIPLRNGIIQPISCDEKNRSGNRTVLTALGTLFLLYCTCPYISDECSHEKQFCRIRCGTVCMGLNAVMNGISDKPRRTNIEWDWTNTARFYLTLEALCNKACLLVQGLPNPRIILFQLDLSMPVGLSTFGLRWVSNLLSRNAKNVDGNVRT